MPFPPSFRPELFQCSEAELKMWSGEIAKHKVLGGMTKGVRCLHFAFEHRIVFNRRCPLFYLNLFCSGRHDGGCAISILDLPPFPPNPHCPSQKRFLFLSHQINRAILPCPMPIHTSNFYADIPVDRMPLSQLLL